MDTNVIQRGQNQHFEIKVQNTGSGHHFPTGSPFKSYTLIATIVNAQNEVLSSELRHVFTRTIIESPPWHTLSDSRIPAGGSVDLIWDTQVDQRIQAQTAVLRISIETSVDPNQPIILQEIPIQIL